MVDKTTLAPLTRQRLQQFLPTHELVKYFEELLKIVPGDTNAIIDLVEEVSNQASNASAQSRAARAFTDSVARDVSDLSARPYKPAQTNSPALDYIDFRKSAPHADVPRRMVWNDVDDTINLHHLDGVTQQIGLESYIRVINTSGATITNGTILGFGGVSAGVPIGVKYIADGTMPVGYLGGVATQDIQNGAIGRVTVFGFVRGIDTSAFTVGALLYASPTTPGAITSIKPTAPQFAIPIGVASVISSTAGEIFVRPILEQTKHYGRFNKTTNQTPAAINTAYTITFDSASAANGISIGAPTSRLVIANAGLYSFSFSVQLVSGSASVKNVWVWLRKNGADIANSSLKLALESATAITTQSRSVFESVAAGDYIELMWASDSTNVTLSAVASTAFAPAAPACIMSISQIQQ